MELGDIEQAQKHFQWVLVAPEDRRALVRNGLREITARELKARGPRMDAVFYLLDAMRLFRGRSLQEIQEITFEIGMLGKCGFSLFRITFIYIFDLIQRECPLARTTSERLSSSPDPKSR